MKEPYGEGLASHTDPESCVASRKAGREALTGAHVGGVLSREISGNQDADAVYSAGRPHWWARYREHPLDLRGLRPPKIGRFFSTANSSLRTVAVIAAGSAAVRTSSAIWPINAGGI